MNKSINEVQDEIIGEFGFFEDWMEKYEHIITFGKQLPPLEERYKTDDNIVRGCQSRVWLHAEMYGDKLYFKADSDAIITKGLVGLVVKVLSGHSPAEIANANLYFADKIGLKEHLSPNRANGLVAMMAKMKMYGLAFDAKMKGAT